MGIIALKHGLTLLNLYEVHHLLLPLRRKDINFHAMNVSALDFPKSSRKVLFYIFYNLHTRINMSERDKSV